MYIISFLQDGDIPLFSAIRSRNWKVANELLRKETEAQVCYINNSTNDSALHIAAREQDNDMVKLLLQLGAGIDVQNVCSTWSSIYNINISQYNFYMFHFL